MAIVYDIITADAGTVFATTADGGGAEVGFNLPPYDRDSPSGPTARRRPWKTSWPEAPIRGTALLDATNSSGP
ncbi:hypothetical protein ACFC0M_15615 [Streptomyces sp. NPDC056149]|uniref:hypothetical protein n=1 Tax=Streptomyces sp. NPDC056149 TaxID=3345728 RepID=UPI0035DDB7B6